MSTPQQGESRGGGNFWTKKYGPLPAWGWAAILLVVLIGNQYYKGKKTGATSAAPATGTSSSLVPQWINQTYINDYPPSAPNPTSGSQVPSNPVTIQVPNGYGGWMSATFPSSQAMQAFYTSLGIGAGQPNGGYYPNGLTNAQLTSAVTQAGGTVSNNSNSTVTPMARTTTK